MVVIENKSNAAVDQENQLYRYWHQEVFRKYPFLDYSDPEVKRCFRLVYLPLHLTQKPSSGSLRRPSDWQQWEEVSEYPTTPLNVDQLSFSRDITEWLKETSEKIPQSNGRLKTFLQLYEESWHR